MVMACFEMIEDHVDLLPGKVLAVPTRSTATAIDALTIIRDRLRTPLRHGAHRRQ